MKKEMGDRNGEADCYRRLGNLYLSVGEFDKGRELLEKSLSIKIYVGDTNGEAECYGRLAAAYQYVGEHDNAIELFKKSIGDQEKKWRQTRSKKLFPWYRLLI